ncbi:putative mitochondrial protein [Vitis vinifera]|uniref:Putative mitochondrial protein n=1 Tax=Vitis vinifera TaxID=29760 RepID=A0A438DEI1_VITVI|nr:putative mitochondrial protein [Vitis vinifera]
MNLSTYIGQIASLKEEFLTVMPLTTDVGDQRTQIDKFFMVLMLIGLRLDLETTLPSDNTSDSSVLVFQTNSRGGRSVTWAASPHCPRGQSSDPQPPQPSSSSTSQGISFTDSEYDDYLSYQATESASVTSVAQTGNASACLTHTSSLGPWILDFSASDHIFGNKDFFFSITTTSALPAVTLANGLKLWLKALDRRTGKTIGIGCEFQGLYHLTSPSTPAVYHCRHCVAVPPSLAEVPVDSHPIPLTSPAPTLPPSADLPIALRKVKVDLDGQVDRLKARLVAKDYTQVYGSDYDDTFSPIAKIASVCLLLSMVAMRSWPLYYTTDHSVFYHHNSSGQCIYLVVYVDDIVITGSDQNGIQKLKQHLFTHFQTKNLGKLKYFLRIEITQSSSGVVLSQRKYALDILEETGMLDCKPVDTPMDPNVKLIPGQGEPLGDPRRYQRLVGKLNYLTIARPDISFPVSVVSQFLQSPCDSHWDAVIRILRYIKRTPGQGVLYENRGHTQVVGYTDADWAGSPTDRRSTSGYYVFIGSNLISWKSKKQDVVAKSNVEAEYRAMALATCELIWLKNLLRELRFGKDE